MPRQRIHNEWFQPVSRQAYGGGSRCSCGMSKAERAKVGLDPQMYAWGEYAGSPRWRTILYVCQDCFQLEVLPRLNRHANGCGCSFQLQPRSGHTLPPWITLEDSSIRCKDTQSCTP